MLAAVGQPNPATDHHTLSSVKGKKKKKEMAFLKESPGGFPWKSGDESSGSCQRAWSDLRGVSASPPGPALGAAAHRDWHGCARRGKGGALQTEWLRSRALKFPQVCQRTQETMVERKIYDPPLPLFQRRWKPESGSWKIF